MEPLTACRYCRATIQMSATSCRSCGRSLSAAAGDQVGQTSGGGAAPGAERVKPIDAPVYCIHCGATIPTAAAFCPTCGGSQPGASGPSPASAPVVPPPPTTRAESAGGGGSSAIPILLLLIFVAVVGIGVYLWSQQPKSLTQAQASWCQANLVDVAVTAEGEGHAIAELQDAPPNQFYIEACLATYASYGQGAP